MVKKLMAEAANRMLPDNSESKTYSSWSSAQQGILLAKYPVMASAPSGREVFVRILYVFSG